MSEKNVDVNKTKKEVKKSSDEIEIDLTVLLRDFIRGCIRFWWLVIVLALIGAIAMFAVDVSTYHPLYRSQATFTVTTNSEDTLEGSSYNFYYDTATAEQLGLTFPHILSSQLLIDALKEDMGVDVINGSVSASVISNSNMVSMTVTSSDPEDAKAILESTIRVYPNVSRFVIGETKFNMIDPPTLPTAPYNAVNYQKSVIMGAAAGFALAMGFIAIYAFLRRTVNKSEDLEKEISIPCFVNLPLVAMKKRNKEANEFNLVSASNSNLWFSENMETLRLRIEKELKKENKKVLLITSTMPGEGKSLIATSLALRLAKHGKKVLLVDGDLRKQNLVKNLGLEITRSLDDIDFNSDDIRDYIISDDKSKVFFFGGNVPVKNTSYFLSRNLQSVIEMAKDIFDYVIVDAPPAGGFEDALIMKSYCDAAMYVVKQDYAPKSKIIESILSLEAENPCLIGYVMNGKSGILGEYGYGGYASYYSYNKYSSYGKYGYSEYGKKT